MSTEETNRLASELHISTRRASAALERQGGDFQAAVHYIQSGAEASELILNAVGRANSTPDLPKRPTESSYTKKSFGSMFSSLSLSSSRDKLSDDNLTTNNKDRGRDKDKTDESAPSKQRKRASSFSANKDDTSRSSRSRARSSSPFLRRLSARDPSPAVEALKLSQSDVESDVEPDTVGPRRFAFKGVDDEDTDSDDSGTDDSQNQEEDSFDVLTEKNTERNALSSAGFDSPDNTLPADDGYADPDPLGEGVNVVRPEEPLFGPPTSPSAARSVSAGRNPKKKKSLRHDRLELATSRPQFQRDRCTVVLTHGDPLGHLQSNGKEAKRYVVASDLSQESGYAVEWGIGTVLRDGDTMVLVSVQETDTKLDPPDGEKVDRVTKLRNQQERQALASLLVRQVTGLLQRTKLQCTVICQAIHAKNSRRLLLDLIDYTEPAMVIVGSRGLGQLQGILLGSTSHYLIQKSSVPVMVARRRLKRPARRNAHLDTTHRPRSLSEAVIDKAGPGRVDQDVENMRHEIEREENEEQEQQKFGLSRSP